MGILDWFKSKETRASVTNYSGGLTGADLVLNLGGNYSTSGVVVNSSTAMQVAAVQACVRAISEDLAGLSYFVYKRNENGKEKAVAHPLYRLLHDSPNPDMDSFTFRECMTAQVLLHGNAYAYVEKQNARAVALYPLPAQTVQPFRQNGELKYRVNTNGQQVVLSSADILHIRGLSFDGIRGKSPIEQAAGAVGLALAADKFGQKFFENGTMLSGVLTADKRVSDEVKDNLKNSWSNLYAGVATAHKTPLLEEGIKFEPLNVPPEQAQFLELRKFQVLEIARLFRCPPHKIMDLDRATFSNIEHQSISYYMETLRSWVIRWEGEINRKLFFESEKDSYFAEMNVDSIMRGDQTTRYGNYATGIQNGWLTPYRVAELENLPTNGLSDQPVMPLNMTTVSDQQSKQDQTTDQSNDNQTRSINLLIQDAARRVLTKEINAIKRAAKKYADDKSGFINWANDFYQQHAQTVRTTFQPVILTMFQNQAAQLLNNIVSRHTKTSLDELIAAINTDTVDRFLTDQQAKQNNEVLWTT